MTYAQPGYHTASTTTPTIALVNEDDVQASWNLNGKNISVPAHQTWVVDPFSGAVLSKAHHIYSSAYR